jgi:hypothetical protein
VVFLNLGDSYYSTGGNSQGGCSPKSTLSGGGGRYRKGSKNEAMFNASNVQRVTAYDTYDKEPEGYQGHGCLCGSLCDVCREAYYRTSHTYDLLVPMLIASLSATNRESMELQISRSPTSDYSHLGSHIFPAIQGYLHNQDHVDGLHLAFQESMPDEFSQQLLDECLQRASRDECLLCSRSLESCVRECVCKDSCHDKTDTSHILHPSYSHSRNNLSSSAYPYYTTPYLKPKDLCGIPWRVAFALQADGWWLRSDIIWSKPNPMPESVTDRPTKAHEYLFLLTKSARYYYDADAVREEHASLDYRPDMIKFVGRNNNKQFDAGTKGERERHGVNQSFNPAGRNRRTVWHIATAPYSGAHFATYPPALVEPCIKAGTSERGVCPECGSPWERVTEKEWVKHDNGLGIGTKTKDLTIHNRGVSSSFATGGSNINKTIDWQPTCECKMVCPSCAGGSVEWTVNSPCCKNEGYISPEPIPATVFDPFCGSGTTLQVARALGRNGIGLDLSLEYLHLARQRLSLDALDAWGKVKKESSMVTDLPIFEGLA